jgi:hypothetical protein
LPQIRGVNAMLQRRGLEVIETRHMDDALCNKHRAWSHGFGIGPGPYGKSRASHGVTTHYLSKFIVTTYALATIFSIKWL